MITMGQSIAPVAVMETPRNYCVIRLDQRFEGIEKQTDNILGQVSRVAKSQEHYGI